MNQLSSITENCALCGHLFQGTQLTASAALGTSPDLDTRQGGYARTAIFLTIQHCKECGYCSTKLNMAPEGTRQIVESESYRAILANNKLHEVARHFNCAALIKTQTGDPGSAGWLLLTAAWLCDDRKAHDNARNFRIQTIQQWLLAGRKGQGFARDRAQEGLLLVDLYRRCGEFGQGIALAQDVYSGLYRLPDDQQKLPTAVLHMQSHLCSLQDARAYRMDDVIKYSQAPKAWKPRRFWQVWR